MSRLIVTILLSALFVDLGRGCVLAQTGQRRIPYSSQVPIADRLLPNDEEVEVFREPASPPHITVQRRQTYEQEIQGLRLDDVVALVRVENVKPDLIDSGTWIETKVEVHVEQLVHTNLDEPLRNKVQFTLSGGEKQIGAVRVTAGVVPRLREGERYMVVLLARPRIALIRAFRVTAEGVLEPLKSNTGIEGASQTHLIGRKVSEVVQSLRGQ